MTAASATAAHNGCRLVDVLRSAPELPAAGVDPAALADPERYLGVAGHLVDRALADYRSGRN